MRWEIGRQRSRRAVHRRAVIDVAPASQRLSRIGVRHDIYDRASAVNELWKLLALRNDTYSRRLASPKAGSSDIYAKPHRARSAKAEGARCGEGKVLVGPDHRPKIIASVLFFAEAMAR